MPVLVQLKNVPPKATVCQIFLIFTDLNYEPEEITLLERRRDCVFFEMQRLDLAYRAMQLNGRMMLSHSILVAHSTINELHRFRVDHKNVPVDNLCYVPLPFPPLFQTSFSGTIGFQDYNEKIMQMFNSATCKESFSPTKQLSDPNKHLVLGNVCEESHSFNSIPRSNGNVNNSAVTESSRIEERNNVNKGNGYGGVKRKKPEIFVMHQFEPAKHRQKTAAHLAHNADINTAVKKIKLQCSVSATKCFIRWKLPLESSVHHQELEVETNHMKVSRDKLGLVDDFVLVTVPGQLYNVELFVYNAMGNVVAEGQHSFKATFSEDEMRKLYAMALKFAGDMLHPYKTLYRCKPKRYYDSIFDVDGRIMKPYLKDNNGQAACPINGVLPGLFFSARLQNNGQLPHSSPFGEVRMQIPVEKLLDDEKVNMYFADFYCNYQVHYVTLVICKKGSDYDRFCKDRLLLLCLRNNNFLKVVNGQNGKSFCVNLKVWVEIYYTEEISLFEASKFDQIEATGRGFSKEDGLPHNKTCLECNLYPRSEE